MDFAVGLHGGTQAAGGHDVIDGNLKARSQRIAAAETRLRAGVEQIEGIDHVRARWFPRRSPRRRLPSSREAGWG